MARLATTDKLALLFWVCLTTLLGVAVLSPWNQAYADEGSPIAVSFGDSYSSGEGNPPFYGSNDPNDLEYESYLAHRSQNSWPGRLTVADGEMRMTLGNNKGTNWFFFASSGAVASDVLGVDANGEVKTQPKGDHSLDGQLKQLDDAGLSGKVDYVTITIGGNDMGFADVVKNTYIYGNYLDRSYLTSQAKSAWDNIDSIKNSLNTVYAEIAKRCKQDAIIIVAGYPTLVKGRSQVRPDVIESMANDLVAGSATVMTGLMTGQGINRDLFDYFKATNFVNFDDFEACFINANVRLFNAYIEKLVNEASASGTVPGLHFVSVENKFLNHEAYTDTPYINSIGYALANRDLAYAIHPNEKGCEAYAEAVQLKINELEYERAHAQAQEAGLLVPDEQDEQDESSESSSSSIGDAGSKNIALVLDVSGSMMGDPLDATKSASDRFVDVALDNGAWTSLISYDDNAKVLSGFTGDKAQLKAAISQLDVCGGTNMEEGLTAARDLLAQNSADDQYIVLMSDGFPNGGKEGQELISYADSIRDPNNDGKDDVIVYALGFNEDSTGRELLSEIASEGCYFSVQDAGVLEDFFKDIADAINGVKFMYARAACPVDVTVSFNGETLTSAGDIPITRTSFGSLTLEEEESGDFAKVLRLREGQSYDISIVGTGQGVMDYSIGFVDDEGIYSDFRTFSGIDITDQTAISTTAAISETTMLSVDENGDGVVDKTYSAGANQEAVLVDSSWIARAVVAAFAMVALFAIGIISWRRLTKHLQRVDARAARR